ncbi:hypothetical protein ACR1PO_15590 [Chryseobacterium sp. RRHN12]|uniref:hypothetical protein n=1 Tax=Chryseobacterium sp. RRHN12 TaxID=3437884 RepID=UPI003D9BF9D3
MKKQIFIGALALVMMAACQNETNDVPTNSTVTMKNTMSRESAPVMWDKPSQNPFELDGYIHIDRASLRTVFMGVEFNPVERNSEMFSLVTNAVNNKSGMSSRVVANVLCSVQEGDMNIALVNVCDSGNCQQFTVYTFDSGNQYVSQFNGNYALQCAAIYLHPIVFG